MIYRRRFRPVFRPSPAPLPLSLESWPGGSFVVAQTLSNGVLYVVDEAGTLRGDYHYPDGRVELRAIGGEGAHAGTISMVLHDDPSGERRAFTLRKTTKPRATRIATPKRTPLTPLRP